MTHFGVRRLVLLNSGNYIKADVAIDHAIHLSASNNRGKSTLVNSLQFLFIADPNKMRFGTRSLDDSLKHYFGETRSFIVYECRTPTGDQCMLIRGRGSLGKNRFERYIYDGKFIETDFMDEGRQIADFESVRERLADRHLTAVKRTELWNVLAANAPGGSGSAAARLGLLPIKRREQYNAFCEVFVRLLSLQSTDARALRQLIIQSIDSELSERRIDVASEYRDEFARAERTEHELAFMRAAGKSVAQGEQLRSRKAEILDGLRQTQSALRQETERCREGLASHADEFVSEIVKQKQERDKVEKNRNTTLTNLGRQQEKASGLRAKWDKLAELHERWQSYSDEFIAQMRRTATELNRACIVKEQQLADAEQFDLDALRRQVNELSQKVGKATRYIAGAERTLIATLRKEGLDELTIEKLVLVVNADLFRLTIDKQVSIQDPDRLVERAKRLAASVRDDRYRDDWIEIDLSEVETVDTRSLFSVEDTKKQLQIDEKQLADDSQRLKVAEDQAAARQDLAKMQQDLDEQQAELASYDQYRASWEDHQQLADSLEAANQTVTTTQMTLDGIENQLTQLEGSIEAKQDLSQQVSSELDSLNTVAERFREAMLPHGLARTAETLEDGMAAPTLVEELLKHSIGLIKKLKQQIQAAGELNSLDEKIRHCQDQITGFAKDHQSSPRYFSDPDQEWKELIESRLAVDDMETASRNAWDALFTPLAARMNGIVASVRTIKRAVEGIKRGLKSYQVSNLADVEIAVEETPDTFADIVALSEPSGLFTDQGELDTAKRRLQQMIAASQLIDLESLFEIKIAIQDAGGAKRRAASLDEIGSTGTGMTVKAMIFIHLIRAICSDEQYRLHFYIDGLGELDDANLSATAALAVSKGILPITADPRVHLEPLAHPEVTVYSLGQYPNGDFHIDSTRTYHAQRQLSVAVEVSGDA